jgi:hypothetical protein
MLSTLTEFSALDYRTPRSRGFRCLGVLKDVMSFKLLIPGVVSTLIVTSLLMGCEVGGVGDPCTPEDEYLEDFSGFSVDEVNVESRSFQCETRICLVNHFRGRVSCEFGSPDSQLNVNVEPKPDACVLPGSGNLPVKVPVDPQLKERRANDTVYCSCRCDGPEADARYCECPSGFSCEHLVDKLPVGTGKGGQLAGSYCIREGTRYVRGAAVESCDRNKNNCPPAE